MAIPRNYPEWEAKKQKGIELIAAGGCYAIQYWSHTDAMRLCPAEHNGLEIQLEAPIYTDERIASAKKAIELIQQGIDMLDRTAIPIEPEPKKDVDESALAEIAVMCNKWYSDMSSPWSDLVKQLEGKFIIQYKKQL